MAIINVELAFSKFLKSVKEKRKERKKDIEKKKKLSYSFFPVQLYYTICLISQQKELALYLRAKSHIQGVWVIFHTGR